MLPTNVVSFMKKMVAPEESQPPQQSSDNAGTFGKLKQTISSSLLTAQDKVNKISPRNSLVPDQAPTPSDVLQAQTIETPTPSSHQRPTGQDKIDPFKPPIRSGACRVCLKSFKADDFSITCYECQQRVCEDCASYSKLDVNEDMLTWRCSVCRRKMSSRVCLPQDSTDSLLDVPILETLQRRHSDVKLGSSSQQLSTPGSLNLAPPKNSEVRRHSDVSPASIKELEKLSKGKQNSQSDYWNEGTDSTSNISIVTSQREDVPFPPRLNSRRQSRIAKQHSYDDDIKGSMQRTDSQNDTDLNVPIIPRRASAYDVFAPGLLNSAAMQAAAAAAAGSQSMLAQGNASMVPPMAPVRRSSFRVSGGGDSLTGGDNNTSPDRSMPCLLVDEERKMRRRGSQLPDINAIKGISSNTSALQLAPVQFAPPALEDLEAPRRQTSMDGEAIKIVIHDVDSGPICASKRHVVLRRDPMDKAHRTRGLGMRIVGGKAGADGRLFAYVVWTVPGGVAEKCGLQQGDKILEWNNVSLIDRSFEEVCIIMDRFTDVVELLVEHATDFRMCDLLDDNFAAGSNVKYNARKSGSDAVSLGLIPDTSENSIEKSPASPTRRKLPKTPV